MTSGTFRYSQALQGKYRITTPLEVTEDNLKYLYTPGVAEVALECAKTQNIALYIQDANIQ